MRIEINRYAWVLIISILLSGCAGTWTRVNSENTVFKSSYYTTTLPLGWVRIATSNSLRITRDGSDIQRIEINFYTHEKAFEKLKKSASPDMLPKELAELYISNFKAQDANGLPSLEIISNRPAQISGQQGFQLHLKFTDGNGLDHESLVNGFANDKGFYVVRYIAPSLHFFQQHKEQYQATVTHFKST